MLGKVSASKPPDTSLNDDDFLFAAAIAVFGRLLHDPLYLGDWGWDEVIDLAQDAGGADLFGYRSAAITLMLLAQTYGPKPEHKVKPTCTV